VSERVGFVLDAGAFIQLERRDEDMVELARELALRRTPLVTSAAVVAQVWRGGERQVPIAALLRKTEIVDLTDPVARLLGRMLAACGKSDHIDAHVVFLAREREWPVLTSDPDDLLAIDAEVEVERV